ncbi:MAG TPA: zinc ribbon domain-containing protein [Nocardioides sp.]|nr:zinc ribbon domain-containing protein [Nocardioides sp.]
MSSCTSCGAQLGVGRFCTNCGAPVDSSTPDGTPVSTPVTDGDWRTDTAERRAGTSDPRTPPAAVAPPPPPRYPLYADEVVGYTPYSPITPPPTAPATPAPAAPSAVADEPVPAEPDYEAYDEYEYYEERRSPVLWILAAALVLVLVAAGWWFLVRDEGSGTASDQGGTGTTQSASATKGEDVAGQASAKAPKTAPPNTDVNGDQVSYDASNMLDGVPETAWRAPGSAAGMTLTFALRDQTELHQVGLINGYAKTSTDSQGRTFDWYHGNRRIDEVVWVFDDGQKVRQQLEDDKELQMVDVPDIVTSKVRLKIVKVTKPGTGGAARDFTAISEVSMVGNPSA